MPALIEGPTLKISVDNATSTELGLAFQGRLEEELEKGRGRVARAYTGAMKSVADKGKAELRADIAAGGFYRAGSFAKTWHVQVQPGQDVMDPAAFFWNKAGVLLDAFSDGVTIHVKNRDFLAIPQGPAKAIVRRLNQAGNRSRSGFGRFAREENPVARVEAELGVKLVAVVNQATGRGVLVAATAVKLTPGGRKAKRQTGANTVLFALVRQATLKKRIKGRALLAEIKGRFPSEIVGEIASKLGSDQ